MKIIVPLFALISFLILLPQPTVAAPACFCDTACVSYGDCCVYGSPGVCPSGQTCNGTYCVAAGCTAGWLCSGSYKYYQYSDCSTANWTNCDYGCSGGACKSAPASCPYSACWSSFKLYSPGCTGATCYNANDGTSLSCYYSYYQYCDYGCSGGACNPPPSCPYSACQSSFKLYSPGCTGATCYNANDGTSLSCYYSYYQYCDYGCSGGACKSPPCTPNWSCTSWSPSNSSCGNYFTQTRTCTDLNYCGTTTGKPAESQTAIGTTCPAASYGSCSYSDNCDTTGDRTVTTYSSCNTSTGVCQSSTSAEYSASACNRSTEGVTCVSEFAYCFDSAYCNARLGKWTCSGGSCSKFVDTGDTTNESACSGSSCNSTYKCSLGTGDNKYGAGGQYKCKGYCDTSGNCDYADACTDCGSGAVWKTPAEYQCSGNILQRKATASSCSGGNCSSSDYWSDWENCGKDKYCDSTSKTCVSCTAPNKNCNENAADKCETNTNTDANNCGSCGNSCCGSCTSNNKCVKCNTGSCSVCYSCYPLRDTACYVPNNESDCGCTPTCSNHPTTCNSELNCANGTTCDCYQECVNSWCWGSSASAFSCQSGCASAGKYAPTSSECCPGLSHNSTTKQCYTPCTTGCLIDVAGTPTCYANSALNPDNKCQICDTSKSTNSWSNVTAGTDPGNWCGGVDCDGGGTKYYWGWEGNTCYYREDIDAAHHNCNGSGACYTAADVCPYSGKGSSTGVNCDLTCRSGCSGTTTSSCDATCQREPDCDNACKGSGYPDGCCGSEYNCREICVAGGNQTNVVNLHSQGYCTETSLPIKSCYCCKGIVATQITDFGFDPSTVYLGQQTAVRGWLKTSDGTAIGDKTLALEYYGTDGQWYSTGQSKKTSNTAPNIGYAGFYWTPSNTYLGEVSYRFKFAGDSTYGSSVSATQKMKLNPPLAKVGCGWSVRDTTKGCIFQTDYCNVGQSERIGGRLTKADGTTAIPGKNLELWVETIKKVIDLGLTASDGWVYTNWNPDSSYIGTKNYRLRFAGDPDYSESWGAPYTYTVNPAAKCLAPVNLICAGTTNNSITLNWNAVSGATQYKLQYIDESGTWTNPSYTSTTGISKTLTGLLAGTKYYFKIQVEKSDDTCTAPGDWSDSPVKCATTGDSCSWPSTPTCDTLALGKCNITICPLGWDEWDNDCCQYDTYLTGFGYRQFEFDDCTTGCDCDMDLRVKNSWSGPATNFRVTTEIQAKGAQHTLRGGYSFYAGGCKYSYTTNDGKTEACRTEKFDALLKGDAGLTGYIDFTMNCGDGVVNCGEECDWATNPDCKDDCSGLKDTTSPTTTIKIQKGTTDVTSVGWLKADSYTIYFEDDDPAPSSGWKNCEYYINSCSNPDDGIGCNIPIVSLTNRPCNSSINIPVGVPPYNVEGRRSYLIYSGAIDNAGNPAGIKHHYFGVDITPPTTEIK